MRTMTLILSVCILAATAPAAIPSIDAAELDLAGNPLSPDSSFAGVRLTLDNRTSPAGSPAAAPGADIEDVRFRMTWTGTLFGVGAWGLEDPENPWRGADMPGFYQTLDGVRYTIGIGMGPGGWISPFWVADPTPENDMDPENNWELKGVVPAGLTWDIAWKFFGEDVHLFHSPAQGDLEMDGATLTLYDADRTPQTVPEPATLAMLVVGAVAIVRRRG